VTGAEFSGVDFDLLADYVGGALTGTPDEAAVAALIASDPTWQTAHDELAEAMASVGAELSALGAASEPMPAELVVRLDAAFAAAGSESAWPESDMTESDMTESATSESARGSAVADPATIDPELAAPATPFVAASEAGAASGRHLVAVPDGGVGKRGRTTAGDRRRRLRWAAPIAAAAGVIAFIGVGINYLNGQSQSDSTNATSSAAGSGELRDNSETPMMAPDAAASGGSRVLVTGRDYQLTTLASAPEVATGKAQTEGLSGSTVATVPRPAVAPPLDRLTPGAALQACLDAIEQQNAAGPIVAPIVDYARFDGKPALIVRFSAANGNWVWATGPDCGLAGVGAAKLGSVQVG
jgi:hypothetical protein